MPGDETENYWFARHLACYHWSGDQLAPLLEPGPILDAGAGEGYGAHALGQASDRAVAAVELDGLTAGHIAARYPHLLAVRANLVALPFADESFAAAVSLQVIEHIWDPVTFLRELIRCSRGPIIVSTPNRPVHSPDLQPGQRPLNPFHVREFSAAELNELCHQVVPGRSVRVLGLHHGPRIRAWEAVHGSLPEALIKAFDSPTEGEQANAVAFARTIDAGDFRITADCTGAHDLVAVW